MIGEINIKNEIKYKRSNCLDAYVILVFIGGSLSVGS